jgi:ATP-binding cassette, subfamily B, bacterial
MPENTAKSTRSLKISSKLKIVDFLRAHWTALMFAFCAVLGETFTDVLEPWPVKIVVADLLQNKRLPGWIGRMVSSLFGEIQHAILNFAVGAATAIAIGGALSSYLEKHPTTSVSQWVTHDLLQILYNHRNYIL